MRIIESDFLTLEKLRKSTEINSSKINELVVIQSSNSIHLLIT